MTEFRGDATDLARADLRRGDGVDEGGKREKESSLCVREEEGHLDF